MSGPLSSSQWMYASGFYNGVVSTSVRFNDDDDANLNKTFSSAGNRKLWTFSTWFKKTGTAEGSLLAAYESSSVRDVIRISGDPLVVNFQLSDGSNTYNANSSSEIRDSTAWYHLVVQFNSADSTETNRTKIWLNGVAANVAETGDGIAAQNVSSNIGNDKYHTIGARRNSGTNNTVEWDGYIAETHYVNGQALDYTSFAEFKGGVLIPKTYTGSYGTNGFHLKYNQSGVGTASSSTIGADSSGNDNHFTSSNVVASDCAMPDCPENNFANLLGGNIAESSDYQSYATGTYSEGNLKVTGVSGWTNGKSNFLVNSGKWYAECRVNAWQANNYVRIGAYARPARTYDEYFWLGDGTAQIDGTARNDRVGTFDTGDILQIAIDLENNNIFFGKNNTWQNSATAAEIAAGTSTNAFASGSEVPTGDGYYYGFYANPHTNTTNITFNFGQDSSFVGTETAQGNTDGNGNGDFYYTPPTGFLALCTDNITKPTIGPDSATQADDYHNTVLWAGNGSNNAITGVGFQPDWLWSKDLSGTENHIWLDSSRGLTHRLSSNNAEAETTDSNATISSFDADGFTLTQYHDSNANSSSNVGWCWKANGGTTSTNNDGATQSTVQANTTAGFSIVLYTGTNSHTTVGHGLGVAPAMVIYKIRDAGTSWAIWHKNLATPTTGLLELNSTGLELNNTTFWNSTIPTSSVLSVNTYGGVNDNGSTFIAYCFAEIEGYSRFGMYDANGNDNGTFVFLGFRPAFVMLKNIDNNTNGGNWVILDDTRLGVGTTQQINPILSQLKANSSDAEFDSVSYPMADFLSNGFKLTLGGTSSGLSRNVNNANGNDYVYMAFASAPFKYANAF